MKSTRRAQIAVFILVLVPMAVWGAEFRVGDQPGISQSEQIADDAYLVGGLVRSSGAVDGDFLGVGGSLVVSGPVSGDVMVAGGNITILGAVGDDVRAAGGNVVITSAIAGDAIVGGGQVQLSGSGVGGDVVIGGGVVRVDAPVKGDVRIAGGEVLLNAPVAGNVRFDGEKLTLGSLAAIAGDLTYRAREPAVLEKGASVSGKTLYEPFTRRGKERRSAAAFLSFVFFGKFLALFIGALLIGLLFPRYAGMLVANASSRPLLEMGRGLVTLIILPAASFLLFLTVLGIPLGLLGTAGFMGLMVFAAIAAPVVIGSMAHRWIFRTPRHEVSWKTILLGTLLYMLLALVPFVGWIAVFGLVLLTLGAIVKIKLEILRNWRQKA